MRKLKLAFNAPVTLCFIALCFIATLLGVVSGGSLSTMFFTAYRLQVLNHLSWLRCVTSTMGHAGWEHFFNNMLYIILLGPILEEKYGSKVMILSIVLSGLATTLAITILAPNTSVIGASGVVFAWILMSSFTSFREGTIPVTFVLVFVFYIGQEVLNGVVARDNISQMGHIVGGLVGSSIGFLKNNNGKQSDTEVS